jgi:5-methylcytosine-specific restriction endonuclease McrA
MDINSYPALKLNADYRPMTVYPLSTMNWQDTVKLVIAGRVDVVEEYDREVHTRGSSVRKPFSMRLPSIVALKSYQRQDRPVAFTRANVLLRAKNACAYCTVSLTMRDLTFDHVVPQSRGGLTSWLNVVASCEVCNARKGNKPLAKSGLTLVHKPYVPSRAVLNDIAMQNLPFPVSRLHHSWRPYLGVTEEQDGATESMTNPAFPPDMNSADYWNVELEN